jgi:formylglycine-generating enzyme required for sulfatase activity
MKAKFDTNANRLARGGSSYYPADTARHGDDLLLYPDLRRSNLGFRLVRDVSYSNPDTNPTPRSEDVQED